MKTKTKTTIRISTAMVALALASASFAQIEQPPVPGTYYSAKDFEWSPPWPFNPYPELDAVEVEPGIFVFDDTMIPDTPEQAAARAARLAASQLPFDPVAEATRLAAQEAAQKARFQADFAPFIVRDLGNAEGKPVDAKEVQANQKARLLDSAVAAAEAYRANYSNALESVQSQGFSTTVTNEGGKTGFLYGWDLGGATYINMHNAVAADTISTDEVRPGGSSGLGLTGTNQVIGVWDGGDVRLTHQEFTNGGVRVFDMDGVSANGQQWHSTHVTGTLAAKGVVAASGGMAYEARVNAYDAIFDTSEMQGAAATNDLHISNHSYGQYRWLGRLRGHYRLPHLVGRVALGDR